MSISYFDLVTTLYNLINSFMSTIEFSHICRYQDRHDKELLMKEKLNVITNTRAKVALWESAVSDKPMLDLR